MYINDVQFNVDLDTILDNLRDVTPYFSKGFKDSGDDIMCQCPFHSNGQERRPSAGIRKSDGLLHCFACGETRTLPEVITHCFGKDPNTSNYGWQWLIRNYGTVQVEERKDVELDFGRNQTVGLYSHGGYSMASGTLKTSALPRKQKTYVSDEELESYRFIHPYMYKRRLTDDIISLFDIGFDSATNSITFPIRDIYGHTLYIARRSVKIKWFNYPAGVEKPVYGLYELSLVTPYPTEVIICESMLDALTCWVYGKYAVALNGLGNELQFKQLREMPVRKFILATDNDERGMGARKKLRERLQESKIITEYILPNGKKDINELSKEEFINLIELF